VVVRHVGVAVHVAAFLQAAAVVHLPVVGVVVHAQVLPEAQPVGELQLHVVGRVEAQRGRLVLGLLQVNERVGRRVPRDVVFAGNGVGVGGSGVGGRKEQGRADDAR